MPKNGNNLAYSKFEDTIQCSFFPARPTQLENLCKSINETITALSREYIWHRDEFKICLSVFDQKKEDTPTHLTSTTCFGDNIEDEWFIVYLVFQITSQYPDLIVQIEDNDGDFLLIEAADFLPAWANPDTTKNRVFIYQSKIHLIPPDIIELNSNINVQDAIQLLVQKTEETKATSEIQDSILKRINLYPQKINESHHRALVTLPVDIATLLTLKPSLISPLVTSFCNHDMWDAKLFPNIKLENCVTVPILFTKYLYAMLINSSVSKLSKIKSNSQNRKDIALGSKLACGYEIIIKKSSGDIFNSSEYYNFLSRLTKSGYFKDNIKESKQYNELLQKAKDYFPNIECPISSYYCHNISEINNTDEFRNVKDSLLSGIHTSQVDINSDDWLNINPDELNTFLNTHYGKKVVECQSNTPTQITSQLAHFLKKTSDFEGIEYVKEEELDTNKIDFDTDLFVSSVEKMLSLVSGQDGTTEEQENNFSDEDKASDIDENVEKELAFKLKGSVINNTKDEYIIKNLLQSIEEEGISGPSSIVLKTIDVNNMEVLDSDDD